MERLWEVAPPLTWAILTVSSLFYLTGFVLLSHSLVRHKGFGDRYGGLLSPGRLEWAARTGTACLLIGTALWGVELGWPPWALVGLGVLAAVALGLQLAARRREPDAADRAA